MDTKVSHAAAELKRLGMLSCTGDEARAFLHAQLTSDVAGLGTDTARRAGWCSAKGRLMATFQVIYLTGWAPHEGQQKALRPGSAKSRLADALGALEIKAGDKTGPA